MKKHIQIQKSNHTLEEKKQKEQFTAYNKETGYSSRSHELKFDFSIIVCTVPG